MRERVLNSIREHRLIKPGDRVGVAVSGGADSVALLRVLLELREELGIVLSVVHFNHKIRGADADADEGFVAALASEHDLEFYHSSADVPAFAAEHKLSLETAGRELRYIWFRQLLADSLDKIATGHTQDDQAETVLMRLIRGAGTKGLAGIHPVQTFERRDADGHKARASIVRPLLWVRHCEIEAYLRSLNQPWRTDATNLEPKHLRNRVRRQLVPLLERDFNPAVTKVLSDLAEIAREEEQYFAEKVACQLAEHDAGSKAPRLNLDALVSLPIAIRRRLVRTVAEEVGIILEFAHIEAMLHLARAKGGSGRCELPDGWVAIRSGRELCFARRSQTKEADCAYEYPLSVPGEVFVKEINTRIRGFLKPSSSQRAGYNRDQLLDPQAARGGLTVRNWRPGDRFWPAHTKAPTKVKELLQQLRVAPAQRPGWPVVAAGNEILWVRGLPARADRLPPENSPEALVIEEVAGEAPKP